MNHFIDIDLSTFIIVFCVKFDRLTKHQRPREKSKQNQIRGLMPLLIVWNDSE